MTAGFFVLRSRSDQDARLAFECETCHVQATFAAEQQTCRVTHCGRTDVFTNTFFQNLRLPRRRGFTHREVEQGGPITVLSGK